jgi:hypothetical protein
MVVASFAFPGAAVAVIGVTVAMLAGDVVSCHHHMW